MEIRIPFAGFYETMWSSEMDNIQEREAESIAEEREIEPSEVSVLIYRFAQYGDAYVEIAEAYVPAFQQYLHEELKIDVELTFNDINSPREYNFETDRIFAEISLADAQKLFDAAGREAVAKAAKKLFTSRSGFISFYSPDITEWGELQSWDHNQLYTILFALADDKDYTFTLLESMCEVVSNAFLSCIDWDRVNHELDLERDNTPADASLDFPRGVTDPQQYIAKFEELNHLKGPV